MPGWRASLERLGDVPRQAQGNLGATERIGANTEPAGYVILSVRFGQIIVHKPDFSALFLGKK